MAGTGQFSYRELFSSKVDRMGFFYDLPSHSPGGWVGKKNAGGKK